MTNRGKRGNGDGSLRQRPNGLWEARYCVIEDGLTVRRSLYAHSRDEAARRLRAAVKARDDGRATVASREPLHAFLGRWMTGAAPSLRPPSVRRYRNALDGHIVPTLGRLRLGELTPRHVQEFYSGLIAKGLSPATVRLVHFVLHRALEQATRWELVPRNVADLVDLPRLPHVEAAALEPEQVRAVLDAAIGDPYAPLLVTALTTGLRRGELIALSWRDIDLDNRWLVVRGTMQPDGTVAEPKSRSSRRRVPLGGSAVSALREHRAREIERRLRFGIPWSDEGFVFTSDDAGSAVAPMTLLRHWYAALDAADLPRMPFHATRHSAATLMVAAGISPRVAAERLGHATAALTLDRYSHVTEGMRHDAAEAIDRVILG